MQPTDQISTASAYSIHDRISSGALYHLVATYCVRAWLVSSGADEMALAIPEIYARNITNISTGN